MIARSAILLINNKIIPSDLLNPFKGFVEIKNIPDTANYNVVAVYDAPCYLPFWFKALKSRGFEFKYQITLYFEPLSEFKSNNLLISHTGLLIASKKFKPNKVRVPHQFCAFCKQPLKDWGGKRHLMHPEGCLISDVWKDMPLTYKDIVGKSIPPLVIQRLEQLFGEVEIIDGKKEILNVCSSTINRESVSGKTEFFDIVVQGDAIEELKKIPCDSVDTVFIDPPYNLGKEYTNYEDERKDYVEWSLKWLEECFRVLKPRGSLFLLNIPKWANEIAVELFPKYYLVRWIVWDEPAEPRGKLIPAHYSLLWMAKTPEVRTYPLGLSQDSQNYCSRTNCIKIRKTLGVNDKIEARDVRWDIHRIKHRGKRFKLHPVQLPEKLLEFVLRLTTKEGDIVLDPMCGTGTTLVVAKRLRRKYIGIDIDPVYVEITKKRVRGELSDILETNTNYYRNGNHRLTQKWIQIKIGELARKLNRLPTLEEVAKYLRIREEILCQIFPKWTKALKLAKIVLENSGLINIPEPLNIKSLFEE